jgi:hypothetical protein
VGSWGILSTWFKGHSGLIKIKDKLGRQAGETMGRNRKTGLGYKKELKYGTMIFRREHMVI